MTSPSLLRALTGLLVAAAIAGCAGDDRARIVLVTTTSVEASGLLDTVLTAYHGDQDQYRLATTAVGSGAALEIGRRGDADVLLTHAPHRELRFMEEGHGLERGAVMRNRFVLLGPGDDPAGIAAAESANEALERIAATGSSFLSRGDDSGTHARERQLWASAGLEPWTGSDWYIEAGTGMGETLQMASQLGAYVLADNASFRFLRDRLALTSLFTEDANLDNHYSYILPARSLNPE
ncbi:MAG TPA: substrate-binding domain-containing protein [Longimicrobiales bacterium]|nr:substrate-binding domain-containing protein [Longimicrobiales bacterium]